MAMIRTITTRITNTSEMANKSSGDRTQRPCLSARQQKTKTIRIGSSAGISRPCRTPRTWGDTLIAPPIGHDVVTVTTTNRNLIDTYSQPTTKTQTKSRLLSVIVLTLSNASRLVGYSWSSRAKFANASACVRRGGDARHGVGICGGQGATRPGV